jgi:Tol biopolymer transport system component
VAFASGATNFVAGDTNGATDVFVHDRQTGTTTRVSVASDGTQGNGDSSVLNPRISSDGRFVAFASLATNLVAGDTNAVADVFVHDRQTGATTRVSVASGGSQANGASGIFFPSLSISSDGRFVGFDSDATNLVSGDTNAATDVFVHDRQTGATTRVSRDSDGIQGNNIAAVPSLSPDGRFVGLDSDATNLVSGDSNGVSDIFVHDRQMGTTTRVSIAGDGAQANGNSFNASAAGP